MNEFDISYEGYTPEELPRRDEPYRPPRANEAYRGSMNSQPYRPPVLDDPDTSFEPIETEDIRPKPQQEIRTQAQSKTQRQQQPQQTSEQYKQAERAESAQSEQEQERQRTAEERKKQRERRLEELRRQEQSRNRTASIINFFKDERTRLFLAITLIICSVFVVITVFSHFRHGAEDQSVAINLNLSTVAENQGLVGNAGGGVGAWLSHVLLCDALGLGSLILVPYLWILSLGLLGIRKCKFWATTFRCLLLAITISIVLGLVTYNWETVLYWGGNHGHYINKWLLDNSTWIGAVSVSAILIAAVCCVYLNELRIVYNKWRDSYKRHKLQEELRRERRRELERLEEEAEKERLAEEARNQAHIEQETADEVADESDDVRLEIRPAHISTQEVTQQDSDEGDTPLFITDEPEVTDNTNVQDTERAQESGLIIDLGNDTKDIALEDSIFVIDHAPETQHNTQETQVDETFSISVNTIEEAEQIHHEPVHECDGLYDHRAELPRYQIPPIDLLEDRPSGQVIDMEEQQANKAMIEKTLLEYKIPISKIEATVGPTVTLYEIVPAEGVRISQIKRLEDDIALSLKALGIRIIAPIPGKGTVGIEVPNNDPCTVSMRSVINSKKYQECKMALPMAMGATISNDIFIADMAKMPHLLVAGATGMGKSVGLNAIIASLLYKKHPSEMKLVLVDPKMVEFSLYSKLERHYLAKLPNEEEAIITDMKKVIPTLNSLCVEMDNRYELLRDANVRSLEEYNKKFTERRLSADKGHKYLPYIVVIVDEFADLIMTQGKEVEQPIARIAQKARAVGIHMILATQRPSTNVITGLIKANFPGRIAFRVIQMVDSRTILDCPGANQLIGKGDMLFSHNGIMERVQCAFISTEEVEAITQYIDDQVGYEHAYYLPEYVPEEAEGGAIAGASMDRDALFNEAARFVVTRQMGSTSSLQRQFGIGYNRAGKLMDQMEAAGVVGPVNGAKPRQILMDIVTLESILGD